MEDQKIDWNRYKVTPEGFLVDVETGVVEEQYLYDGEAAFCFRSITEAIISTLTRL